MPANLRLFIAVPIPVTTVIESVREELRELGTGLRVSRDDTLHLTVKFLGDTPRNRVPEIESVLQETLSDQTVFPLQFRGIGAFPKPTRPSVVWIGVTDNPLLNSIATRLEDNLNAIGFPKEDRPYHPHITIARVRRGCQLNLSSLCQNHQKTELGTQSATPFVLYESILNNGPHSNGPLYNALSEISLS